jgi:NAD(P)-dependent dehydrogenase (short-subunit alcohol dehydrogenase family)
MKDRVVLVTGATEDLGRAAARALAEHGATVILMDRKQKDLEAFYDELVAAKLPTPAILPFALATASLDVYDEAARVIETELGRLDGLLHTAEELGALAPLELYDPGNWVRVLHANLTARWLLTRALLPLLKKSKDASIVFSTADVARRARAYWGAYAVAGFGNEALVQLLAEELTTNTSVRVNSLDPGPVRTFARSRAYPGENPQTLPEPKDVMPAYLYLLGADSLNISGRQF